MMEAKKFFKWDIVQLYLLSKLPVLLWSSGPTAYHKTYTLAHLPDDITVGLTIGKPITDMFNIMANNVLSSY